MPWGGGCGLWRRWGRLAGLAAVGLCAMGCVAQEGKVVPSTPGSPYTLHVYANRVQVPTLVVDRKYATERGLGADAFSVRLDAGPKFHPLAVRVEGDDPLTVALVVDATRAVGPEMLANLELELNELPDGLLTERDHVSVYAVDCAMLQSSGLNMPATGEGLRKALQSVLGDGKLHTSGAAPGCDDSRRLWDAVAVAARGMGSLPGRRVMIVVADGVDHGSVNHFKQVLEYVDSLDVTVVGIRSGGPPLPGPTVVKTGNEDKLTRGTEDPFSLLCAGSGGFVLDTNGDTVAAALEKAIRLVRERYVLEFLRPRNSAAGIHLIDVTVSDRKAVVRPGGVLVELENADLAKDPSVVPTDQSRAPVLGTRRALSAQ